MLNENLYLPYCGKYRKRENYKAEKLQDFHNHKRLNFHNFTQISYILSVKRNINYSFVMALYCNIL